MYFIYILRTSEGRRARHAAYTSSLFLRLQRGARGCARTREQAGGVCRFWGRDPTTSSSVLLS